MFVSYVDIAKFVSDYLSMIDTKTRLVSVSRRFKCFNLF